MKGTLSAVAVIAMGLAAALFVLQPAPAYAVITATSTITGWLTPDATHLGNSILVILIPLGSMVVTAMLPGMMKVKGDVGVYFAAGGLVIGSVVADLSATSSNTLAVPFADSVVLGLMAFLYWWNS